jgi:sulfite reductase (ferredoxin)
MYIIPNNLAEEIKEYGTLVAEYEKGNINHVKFKSVRVPLGVYEQRGNSGYMIRIRCAAGFVKPSQLIKIAELAHKYGTIVHITTRQELQIHNVELRNTPLILKELFQSKLGTKGSGGNTIRNITTSSYDGISHDDVFDVSPYIATITSKIMNEPDSWTLPRKVKIAFSSNSKDEAFACFHDLGFIAEIKDGKRGFKVYLGGGYGVKPRVADKVIDFAPEEDLFFIIDAVKKMFSQHGNRRNRHKARMRFLFYKLGREKTLELFAQYLEDARKKKNNEFKLQDIHFINNPNINNSELLNIDDNFTNWKNEYTQEQAKSELFSVIVPIHLGNINPEQLIELGNFLLNIGEDTIRCTIRQNFHLRNIPKFLLENIYQKLNNIGIETKSSKFLNNIVSCTGADTCRLGMCLSKGLLNAVRSEISSSKLDFDKLKNVRINISGCPNSCGAQHIADIGLQGRVARNGRLYPAYNILTGVKTLENEPSFSQQRGSISAKDTPKVVKFLLEDFSKNITAYSSFQEYIQSESANKKLSEIIEKFENIPSFEENPNYYYDWGANEPFAMTGENAPECAAGMFDMIDVDKSVIEQILLQFDNNTFDEDLQKEELSKLISASSRMLLVTRGVDAKNEQEIFDEFVDKFINSNLISREYLNIIHYAKQNDWNNLYINKNQVVDLAKSIIELHKTMDDSLQFNIDKNIDINQKQKLEEDISKNKVKDLRGVACPMNFVKTKLELATMKAGEILEVWLDHGAPIENVPRSCEAEGHKICTQNKTDEGYWIVKIQKKEN